MYLFPNELFTAFSFIGFVLCAIPFYWHLEAWNTGTCLFMIWTGLGCLLQGINSVIWNKNTTNRAPVYCDISTRILLALNVAIPACSLCINRRLYKIATMKVMTTYAEKRRAVIHDLLIGVGLPILQIAAQHIVATNRYNIFEDFGPAASALNTPLSFILILVWPVVIGSLSLFYCVMTIYSFYIHQRQFRQIMSSSQGLSRGRYLRLTALSATGILGSIPLGTYFIVNNAKKGVTPWISWAETHRHYSEVIQIPGFIWKNDPYMADALEISHWLIVACAFAFFAFFGFADEARQHYRRMYTSLAGRIGYATSALHGSSRVTPSVPCTKSKDGVAVSVVAISGNKRRSSISLVDQVSIPSISIAIDNKPDFKIERHSPSNAEASSSVESFDELRVHDQSAVTLPAGVMPTVPPASVLPHFPDTTKSTMRAYSGVDAV